MAKYKIMQLGTAGPLYGAERWILALSRNLDSDHVHNRIVTINDLGDATPAPLTDAARAIGLDAEEIRAPGRFNFAAVSAVRRMIADYDIDVVHTHGYKADAVALLASRGTQAKVLATPHGWSHSADVKLRFYEWLDRQMFRFADSVAPLSPDLADTLSPSLEKSGKLELIPNGVDLLEIDAETHINADVAALRQKGPVIGYVGQLIPRKNLPLLLKAFSEWQNRSANLVLIGEGHSRAALEAEADALGIADRTIFAGWQSDRLAWMRGMDMLVLPSLVEGMPRCVMEAMALRIPVAASDIAGNRDLIRHGHNGQIFSLADSSGLRSCMEALANAAEISTMAQRARETIEQHHSGATMASRYTDLFGRLAA